MDTSIRRVQREAAIQKGAVRAVNARRQRGSKEERGFADELETPAEQAISSPMQDHNDAKQKRPLDGETGSLLDVIG